MKKNRKNRTELGQKIYETRRKMKLSQIEFAQKTGLSEASILRIENGNMAKFHVSTLRKISEAFPDVLPLEDLTKLAGYRKEGAGTLAQKVKNARLAKGLSQELFAQKAGLSRYGIAKIENGDSTKVCISTLRKMSEVFPDVLVMEDLTKLAGYREEGEAVTLAQKVKNARLAKGWSRADLAKKCAVVTKTISVLELGQVKRPQSKLRRALKKQLGIDI